MLYNADITIRLATLVDAPDASTASAAALERVIPAVPPACHVQAVVTRPLSLVEQLHADNLRVWQETEAVRTGTASQNARWLRGLLPDEELLALAREELFRPFDGFARRQKLLHTEIRHTPMCARVIPPEIVQWSTTLRPPLGTVEFRELERLEAAAVKVASHDWMRLASRDACMVEPREHRGDCTRCGKSITQHSALVTITWAGRTLSREYLL